MMKGEENRFVIGKKAKAAALAAKAAEEETKKSRHRLDDLDEELNQN